MIFLKNLGIAVILTMACAMGSASAQNLIANGGFETGDFTNWNITGAYACVGTSFLCEGVGPLDADPGPHSGTYAAYLGGTNAGGNQSDLLSQPISTTAGQGYYLSFFLAAPTLGGGQELPDSLQVLLNGLLVGQLSDVVDNNYSEYTFWVLGTGSDQLAFDTDNYYSAFVLDDVSLVSAPEPGALSVLAIGLIALGIARLTLPRWASATL